MSGEPFDAIVIGAGVSGLVTAFQLHQRGRRVAVLDANAVPGGVVGTRERDGFLYETGANSTLDSTPLLDALLSELGILSERIDASPLASHRYIVRSGKLVALPHSPAALLRSPLFSLSAKLGVLREPWVRPADAHVDESIAAFTRRRLGSEILDQAVDPFVAGIYAGEPEQLSAKAAFPRLHALEQRHGSLLRGQIAAMRERRRTSKATSRPRSFSFRRGMRTLPEALAARIPHYLPRTRVDAIARDADGRYAVHTSSSSTLHGRALVIATPAHAAAQLIESLAPQAAAVLRAIEYAPVAIVASAWRREDVAHDLRGFGFLVPGKEKRRILGTLFSSSVFEGRAPPGHVLLTTFVGGSRDPNALTLSDQALTARVAEELEALVGARNAQWFEIVRWPQAIPQYTIGHRERIAAIDVASAPLAKLYYCASWRDGIAVFDRVINAYAVAQRVDEALQNS